jgi:amino-acid N-acetyltransferase
MIHANDYQQIRRARKKDAQGIYDITRHAVKSHSLRHRSKNEIEHEIDRYIVYEIDGSIVGCAMLYEYPAEQAAEIASVLVQPFYQNRGVGRKLIEFLVLEATRRGARRIFVLTTQSYAFFKTVCQFEDARPEDLPDSRAEEYRREGRQSRVLVREI